MMASVREVLRRFSVVLAGGLVYVLLNWIPLLGPLAVGVFVGFYSSKSVKDGVKSGLASGLLGSVLVALFLFNAGFFSAPEGVTVVSTWILLVWNTFGVLACGLGGALGVVASDLRALYQRLTGRKWVGGGDAVVYRICPACGKGTREGGLCVECGSVLP